IKFENQAKAFEVLSELKTQQNSFNVPSAGIIVKDQGNLLVKDFFNFDGNFDHWAVGGIIGSFIGIIGGPLGEMLGASLGGLLGSAADVDEAVHKSDIFTEIASTLNENSLYLVVLIKDDGEELFDTYLKNQEASEIYRESIE
ncbi:DUF1269 domain-containing protein, partial [Acinetobacter baumannii]|uniref:DUF1269 domain-containing protein n=1 Tax=Acinetobacter baumannii TaxID=470 RepID=UPI001AECF503